MNSSVMLLQITFDVPYFPGGGRYYDYRGLGDIVDFLFIMAYVESYGSPVWANSPLNKTTDGRCFGSNLLLENMATQRVQHLRHQHALNSIYVTASEFV